MSYTTYRLPETDVTRRFTELYVGDFVIARSTSQYGQQTYGCGYAEAVGYEFNIKGDPETVLYVRSWSYWTFTSNGYAPRGFYLRASQWLAEAV